MSLSHARCQQLVSLKQMKSSSTYKKGVRKDWNRHPTTNTNAIFKKTNAGSFRDCFLQHLTTPPTSKNEKVADQREIRFYDTINENIRRLIQLYVWRFVTP